MVITSVFPDQSTTETSTSTTSTCYTVTACTGSATTVSTTASSTTTIQSLCARSNCGAEGACPATKRARDVMPTTTPISETGQLQGNFTLSKREFPPPGTGDWNDFYQNLLEQPNTIKVNNLRTTEVLEQGLVIEDSLSAVSTMTFDPRPGNIVVEGLYGCTAVIAVSHLGKRI